LGGKRGGRFGGGGRWRGLRERWGVRGWRGRFGVVGLDGGGGLGWLGTGGWRLGGVQFGEVGFEVLEAGEGQGGEAGEDGGGEDVQIAVAGEEFGFDAVEE